MAKVSTGPRPAPSHRDTAGSDSISRAPPATDSPTQPMSGSGPVCSAIAATRASAVPRKRAEANRTASDGASSPSAFVACATARVAASPGSSVRTRAPPAFTRPGYPGYPGYPRYPWLSRPFRPSGAVSAVRSDGDEDDAERGQAEADSLDPAQPLAQHHPGQQHGDARVQRGQHYSQAERTGPGGGDVAEVGDDVDHARADRGQRNAARYAAAETVTEAGAQYGRGGQYDGQFADPPGGHGPDLAGLPGVADEQEEQAERDTRRGAVADGPCYRAARLAVGAGGGAGQDDRDQAEQRARVDTGAGVLALGQRHRDRQHRGHQPGHRRDHAHRPGGQARVEDDQAQPADRARAEAPGQPGQAGRTAGQHRRGERDDHPGRLHHGEHGQHVRPAGRHAAEEVAATVEHGGRESEKNHHDPHLRSLVTSKTFLLVTTRPVKAIKRSRLVSG